MLEIPADWLATNPRLPDCCAKHGLPAIRRVDFVAKSRPQIARKRRLFAPGYTAFNRADEYLSQVKLVRVQGWPLCARCVRRRRTGLVGAGFLFFGGLLAMVLAGSALADETPVAAFSFLAGFAAILLSPWLFSYAGLPRLTGTQVTPDGAAVRVDNPRSEFSRQLADRPND